MSDSEPKGVYSWIEKHRLEAAAALAAAGVVAATVQHHKHKSSPKPKPEPKSEPEANSGKKPKAVYRTDEAMPVPGFFDEADQDRYREHLRILDTNSVLPATHEAMLMIISTLVHEKEPRSRQELCKSALTQVNDFDLTYIDLALKHAKDVLFYAPEDRRRKFWVADESVWWAASPERATEYPEIHKAIANFANESS